MSSTEYQGYTNRATWSVRLYLVNDLLYSPVGADKVRLRQIMKESLGTSENHLQEQINSEWLDTVDWCQLEKEFYRESSEDEEVE